MIFVYLFKKKKKNLKENKILLLFIKRFVFICPHSTQAKYQDTFRYKKWKKQKKKKSFYNTLQSRQMINFQTCFANQNPVHH